MCKSPQNPPAKHKSKKKQLDKNIELDLEPQANDEPANMDKTGISNGVTGQHFYMDFGFVRGSRYSIKQED